MTVHFSNDPTVVSEFTNFSLDVHRGNAFNFFLVSFGIQYLSFSIICYLLPNPGRILPELTQKGKIKIAPGGH